MDHSLSGLIGTGITTLIAFVVGFGLIGGIVNSHRNYWIVALWAARIAVCLSGGYPLLWAHRSHYPTSILITALGIWGLGIGLLWYAAGLWHRWELDRSQGTTETAADHGA